MRYTHVVVPTESAFKVVTSKVFERYYRGKIKKAPKWGTYQECLTFVKSA